MAKQKALGAKYDVVVDSGDEDAAEPAEEFSDLELDDSDLQILDGLVAMQGINSKTESEEFCDCDMSDLSEEDLKRLEQETRLLAAGATLGLDANNQMDLEFMAWLDAEDLEKTFEAFGYSDAESCTLRGSARRQMAPLAMLIETVIMLLTGSVSSDSIYGLPTANLVANIERKLAIEGCLIYQPKALNRALPVWQNVAFPTVFQS
ncbi:hypothetical protein FPSE_03608 [Fusarium pseudograminearum CS3096]|uniref:Uncharacterized protein n=1 Tax=Fusarium pseudograminearum (strain CS3096) TaxID=1028729 RepID=K3VQG8_FUSPC|nr:hypothetical protein FPSE_03608 [Fusarium pseudograminearum CS3096]EKJ76133.1 hypothetical protein FPSE_03608 [Fusarium pseudograminearum CS3096]